jgi:hypothetical protein
MRGRRLEKALRGGAKSEDQPWCENRPNTLDVRVARRIRVLLY